MNNERNRVNSMSILRDHMKELFELIGMESKAIVIRPLPMIPALIEQFFKDNALYSYLESLDADCVRAIETMKKRNLMDWNHRKLMQKHTDLKDSFRKLQQQNEQLILEKAEEEKKSAQLEAAYQQKLHETLQDRQLQWIRELISLSDSALMRKAWVEENASDNEKAKQLAATQLKSIHRLLENMGAEILEDSGKSDCRLHMIMATIPTTDAALADHIAETVRPGYRFGGEILRPQEVIVYAFEEGES